METKKGKYDTNPLDPDVARETEEVWGESGGSIRIHRRDIQDVVFKALGMNAETARARFGFFLEALSYGTPPHGGIASGIERLMMVLVPTENIRDVMAFPKTASATDLMIDAPGEVDPKQLEELKLKIVKDE